MSLHTRKEFRRLSDNVVPSHYTVSTKVDFDKMIYSGSAKIRVKVASPSKEIEFNSLGLEFSNGLFRFGNETVTVSDVKDEPDHERTTVSFPNEIPSGEGTLEIDFVGKLEKVLYGLYLASYTKPDGTLSYIASTQFESTYARKAFPCWDEPALKATFDIVLTVPKGLTALSNTNVKNVVEHEDGYVSNYFETTPIMSTYLVAYAIGEFESVSGVTSDGIEVNVFSPVGKGSHGQFALDVTLKTLPFYSEYFDIPYPLPKCDLIAIPDFAAGAMENWGLITYRETALLIDPAHSSAAAKQRVALVVGHELAHQWFGNLVTMEWWTDLWLNEGFASWIEYLCVDMCFPNYDIWTQFIYADYSRALDLDALENSHPILVEVGHPEEVDQIFDAISYSKGCSVIRMIHDFIGDECFKIGLRSYLNEFKFRNAKTVDLWHHLSVSSGKPIAQIMDSWTLKMGYPVLTVSRKDLDENGTVELTISQKKFCTSDNECVDSQNNLWIIPISIYTEDSKPEDQPFKTFILDKQEEKFVFKFDSKPKMIKLNKYQVGFYRVNYSDELLIPILQSFKEKFISPQERIGLQNDLNALSKSGLVSADRFLSLFVSCCNEDNCTVWQDILSNISEINILMQNDPDYDASVSKLYKKMIISVLEPIFNKLGWETLDKNDHLGGLLRGLVISKLGFADYAPVVNEAYKRFDNFYKNNIPLDPNTRSAVFGIVIRKGKSEDLDKLIKIYLKSTLMEEKVSILSSLGIIEDLDSKKRVLDFSLTDQIRPQDLVYILNSLIGSKSGRSLLWDFLKHNWQRIYELNSGGGFLLNSIVSNSTKHFATEQQHNDVESFFKTVQCSSVSRSVIQSLETITVNEKWLKKNSKLVSDYLKNNFN